MHQFLSMIVCVEADLCVPLFDIHQSYLSTGLLNQHNIRLLMHGSIFNLNKEWRILLIKAEVHRE